MDNVTPPGFVFLGSLLGAMALSRAGYKTRVYAVSRKPNAKADLAESVGVPYLSAEETPSDALASRIGPVDVVYEAAGASQTAFDLMATLAIGVTEPSASAFTGTFFFTAAYTHAAMEKLGHERRTRAQERRDGL